MFFSTAAFNQRPINREVHAAEIANLSATMEMLKVEGKIENEETFGSAIPFAPITGAVEDRAALAVEVQAFQQAGKEFKVQDASFKKQNWRCESSQVTVRRSQTIRR